jgi:hypothetical protein
VRVAVRLAATEREGRGGRPMTQTPDRAAQAAEKGSRGFCHAPLYLVHVLAGAMVSKWTGQRD